MKQPHKIHSTHSPCQTVLCPKWTCNIHSRTWWWPCHIILTPQLFNRILSRKCGRLQIHLQTHSAITHPLPCICPRMETIHCCNCSVISEENHLIHVTWFLTWRRNIYLSIYCNEISCKWNFRPSCAFLEIFLLQLPWENWKNNFTKCCTGFYWYLNPHSSHLHLGLFFFLKKKNNLQAKEHGYVTWKLS